MNFGEKLKQIRIERSMTQPQLAEAIGIEQSYLSKLENDKSVPSAEMFQAIVQALAMDASDFLKDIDKGVLHGTLRQIPEVANFITVAGERRLHNATKWLVGSGLACAFGFALMLAANDGILFANVQYRYESAGVILMGESEDIFKQYANIQAGRLSAQLISPPEYQKLLTEFEATRAQLSTLDTWTDKGSVFFQDVEKGRRKFELVRTEHLHSLGNKLLQFLGALLMFSGLTGFFIEWRLRKFQVH